MIIKELKITNSNGDSIEFGRHFKLNEGLDLSRLGANVNYSDSTSDGAHYQNTKLDIRDFDLAFFIDINYQEQWWVEERRQELFRVFNPKFNPMRLDFETKGGSGYFLNANITSAPFLPQGFENDNRSWQKGLLQFLCTDPFIYSASSSRVDIALWKKSFKFPLKFQSKIQMGYRAPSLIVNVFNPGQERAGMDIRFNSMSEVVNPKLLNVNTYEELKLNFTMQAGDIIDISTYKGKRSITLIRNNIKSNIFNTLDFATSTFLQLSPGDNLFRYDADAGLDYLEVSINFNPPRIGV